MYLTEGHFWVVLAFATLMMAMAKVCADIIVKKITH